ncbi:MAG: DNA mismatch repair endonuclease MutL [Kiritimatiellae bacterium]|nr:DNA mismatch repair endonuclease MutL [Kiritimatiellia bacterium]
MMVTPIHVLSDQVANKIAAGEVVDRPASVVKELMENALDAGATHIDVEIVSGGRKLISVSDNGHGMDRDNALLSLERHATSKIKDVDDIERVDTLGFRGEALAAIASVSRFSLTTRTAEALCGTEITVSGGKIQDVQERGCPPGTKMQVRNLFFNVPARRKFLRTEQTEQSHVRQVFLVYGLSYPAVDLKLTVDSRELYRLAGGATLEERLRDLYSAAFVETLRVVSYEQDGVKITGCVGLPQTHRGDRSEQYIFINGRPASAPILGAAINEAYQTLIPKGRYPLVFLFIELDPSMVDINVHPTKKEVRFRRPGLVRDILIESIRSALTTASAGSDSALPTMPVQEESRFTKPILKIENMPTTRTFQYPRMPLISEETAQVDTREPSSSSLPLPLNDEQDISSKNGPWTSCRVLGQVGGLYVILETEGGLVLMDPHAAHERILFERFMNEVLGHKVKGQGLLVPETVELGPQDALRVRKNMTLFEKMGFGISEFGGDTFIVDAIPNCLGNVSALSVLADVAHSFERGGARGGTEKWAEEKVARAACRAAVKARDKLTLEEIEQLVVDLARAEMPYTCPHGRPTLILMSFPELDKKFGRA